MMMIGRVSTTEPAISTVVGTSTLPESCDRPSETVQCSRRSTRNSSANRNSFQAIMNTNSPVDMIDGMASGRLICRSTPSRLRPSTSPASSIDDRHRLEVVAQHVDRHRHGLGGVDDHQPDQRPAQPEPGEQHEQRDGHQDRREQVRGQEQPADLASPEERQPGDRVRARDADQQRQDHRGQGDERAVGEEAGRSPGRRWPWRTALDVGLQRELRGADEQRRPGRAAAPRSASRLSRIM